MFSLLTIYFIKISSAFLYSLISIKKLGYEDYESYDFEYGEYADNGYAADILDFLDELEALIDDGGADAAAPPLHMIIVRLRPDLYEGLGDTGGLMERAGDRAAELYARACREGRPDVGALAVWLAQFRLEGLSCPELARCWIRTRPIMPSWVSPGPRRPMLPFCCSRWVQPRTSWVDRCLSWASSTCNLPS